MATLELKTTAVALTSFLRDRCTEALIMTVNRLNKQKKNKKNSYEKLAKDGFIYFNYYICHVAVKNRHKYTGTIRRVAIVNTAIILKRSWPGNPQGKSSRVRHRKTWLTDVIENRHERNTMVEDCGFCGKVVFYNRDESRKKNYYLLTG